MGAIFTVSYWITLVTAIPGLITVATVYFGVASVNAQYIGSVNSRFVVTNDWIILAVIITIMILTQVAGILLEEILIKKRWLGRKAIQPYSISPYEEYSELYIILAKMKDKDDPQGHLRRAVAQFFMTMNVMISFLAGMVVVVITVSLSLITVVETDGLWSSAAIYFLFMMVCLGLIYPVTIIRFREMARSIWAVRNVAPDVAEGKNE